MALSIAMSKEVRLLMRVYAILVWTAVFCQASAASVQGNYYSNSQREQHAPQPDPSYNVDPSYWSSSNSPVVPYGGDTVVFSFRQQEQPPPYIPPPVKLEDVALSLRFTCEMNRRLYHGTKMTPAATLPSAKPALTGLSRHQPALEQRGGQTTYSPVNVHPSQSWQPPIRTVATTTRSTTTPELTLFHAKTPRRRHRGVTRWGPNLHQFLGKVTAALGIDDSPIVLALAMIYMDRACSVETPRNYKSCPCATPRTVHRLAVVALLLASKTVYGGTTEQYWEKLQMLGIPLEQLQQMESWMMGALGDHGLFVPEEHLINWLKAWHETFSANKPQAPPQI